jgi:hypothetical protein
MLRQQIRNRSKAATRETKAQSRCRRAVIEALERRVFLDGASATTFLPQSAPLVGPQLPQASTSVTVASSPASAQLGVATVHKFHIRIVKNDADYGALGSGSGGDGGVGISDLQATTAVANTPTTLTGEIPDPNRYSGGILIIWGDGTGETDCITSTNTTGSFTINHTYTAPGNYAIAARTENGGVIGDEADTTAEVDGLSDVVITAGSGTGSTTSTVVGAGASAAPFTGTVTFADTGAASGDLSASTVDYGDGSGPTPLTVDYDGTFTLSHQYDQAGDFAATVNVVDADGASATASINVAAVQLNSLTVTDDSNCDNAVTSTAGSDLWVLAGNSGSATVDLSGDFAPVDDASAVLWAVQGGTQSGSFASPQSVTLTPCNGNCDFDIEAGVDTDGTGVLADSEVTQSIDVHVVTVAMVSAAPEVYENSYQPMEVTVTPAAAASHVQLSIPDSSVATFDNGDTSLALSQADQIVDVYGGNYFGIGATEGQSEIDASIVTNGAIGAVQATSLADVAPPTTQPSTGIQKIGQAISDAFSKQFSAGISFLQTWQGIDLAVDRATDKAMSDSIAFCNKNGDIAGAQDLQTLQSSDAWNQVRKQTSADIKQLLFNMQTDPSQLDVKQLGALPGLKPNLLTFYNDGTFTSGLQCAMQPTSVIINHAKNDLAGFATNPEYLFSSFDLALGVNLGNNSSAVFQVGSTWQPNSDLLDPAATASVAYQQIMRDGSALSIGLEGTYQDKSGAIMLEIDYLPNPRH